MPKFRSPVLGFNHNIRHRGWLFHVQTEESGNQTAHIDTHLFQEGVILASKRHDYDPSADVDVVKGLMQAQHKSVLRELKAGLYDGKIAQVLGGAAEPAAHEEPELQIEVEVRTGLEPAAESSPYVQLSVADATARGDLAIADLLGRLDAEAEEAVPEPIAAPPPIAPEKSTWVVTRPGQTERPFERSGPSIAAAAEPVVPVPAAPPVLGVPWFPHDDAASSTEAIRAARPPLSISGEYAVVRPSARATAAPPVAPRPSAVEPRNPPPLDRALPPRAAPSGRFSAQRPATEPPQNSFGANPPRPTSASLARPPGLRRPSADQTLAARPAVVIGAPSVVVGASIDSGQHRRAHGRESTAMPPERAPGQDSISEKSLDEVIMAYLSEDANDE